jgi:hypothetical protein
LSFKINNSAAYFSSSQYKEFKTNGAGNAIGLAARRVFNIARRFSLAARHVPKTKLLKISPVHVWLVYKNNFTSNQK